MTAKCQNHAFSAFLAQRPFFTIMMTLLSILLNPWLHTISALLAPFALRTLPMFRKPSSPTPPFSQQLLVRHAPLRAPITALLALYALYTLHTLAFARPPNLFTTLHLPLNAPQSVIRATLLRRNYMSSMVGMKTATASGGGAAMPELPLALEKLLARLASFDARTILVRCVFPVPVPLLAPKNTYRSRTLPSHPSSPLIPDARLSFFS
jgi:hypothetical protein